MKMLVRAVLAALALAGTPGPAAAADLGGLTFAVPEGYEPVAELSRDGHPVFGRPGARAALADVPAARKLDRASIESFIPMDYRAVLQIHVFDLVPPGGDAAGAGAAETAGMDAAATMPDVADGSAETLHRRLCDGFRQAWGPNFVADAFDPATGIGTCVNFAGAFVATYDRRIGDKLIMVETLDVVDHLAIQKEIGRDFLARDTAGKLDFLAGAANRADATALLASARPAAE
jgi:hypothetical protein